MIWIVSPTIQEPDPKLVLNLGITNLLAWVYHSQHLQLRTLCNMILLIVMYDSVWMLMLAMEVGRHRAWGSLLGKQLAQHGIIVASLDYRCLTILWTPRIYTYMLHFTVVVWDDWPGGCLVIISAQTDAGACFMHRTFSQQVHASLTCLERVQELSSRHSQ
jgi:hypothetical protein